MKAIRRKAAVFMRPLCFAQVLAYTRAVVGGNEESDDGRMMRVRSIVCEFWKLSSLTVMAIVLIASSGCDLTGQYETKFKQALEESNRKSLFDALLHRDFTEVVDSARQ